MTAIHTIASGSSGNAALVSRGGTHILLDAGVSARRISAALAELGLSPQDLSAICITHSHSDHITGLATMVKRWDVPIYATAPLRPAAQLPHRGTGGQAPGDRARRQLPPWGDHGHRLPHLPRRAGVLRLPL